MKSWFSPRIEEAKSEIYSNEQLASLDKKRIPYHVSIIPDGNRRWAMRNAASAMMGHRQGADVIMEIVKAAYELGIKVLTFYTFSTENWMRPKAEVDGLMRLLNSYLNDERQQMIDNKIKLETIGDLSKLPKYVLESIAQTKEATKHGTNIDLVLAINYGARDEIRRAVQTIVEQGLKKEEVTEGLISKYLDTAKWPDPELFIRTSGELRISNFLLWQISYSEVYIADVLWPDFTPHHLLQAVLNYQQRQRRLGE